MQSVILGPQITTYSQVTASHQMLLVNTVRGQKHTVRNIYTKAFTRPTFDATLASYSRRFPDNPKFSTGTNSISRWAVVAQGPYLTVWCGRIGLQVQHIGAEVEQCSRCLLHSLQDSYPLFSSFIP